MFKFCACSEKGTEKLVNEDRVMVSKKTLDVAHFSGVDHTQFMAVICDGVGSTSGGAQAAEIVAKSFEDFDIGSCTPDTLFRHLTATNDFVVAKQKTDRTAWNMATTAAGLVIISDRYLLFNLGDTRIYKYHAGKHSLLSKDHTMRDPLRSNAITRYIGGYGHACFPSFKKGTAESGSLFLLCSDGVYKGVKDSDLEKTMSTCISIEQKGGAILQLSLQNGSTDDRSLVLVECAGQTAGSWEHEHVTSER